MSIVERMQKDAELQALRARVKELEGDLNIMRLQRDAKRFTDETEALRAEVERLKAEMQIRVEAGERLIERRDKEVERLTEELSIWKSVFPDIAPERVLPDRSKLEAENERLRAALDPFACKCTVKGEGAGGRCETNGVCLHWNVRAELEEKS